MHAPPHASFFPHRTPCAAHSVAHAHVAHSAVLPTACDAACIHLQEKRVTSFCRALQAHTHAAVTVIRTFDGSAHLRTWPNVSAPPLACCHPSARSCTPAACPSCRLPAAREGRSSTRRRGLKSPPESQVFSSRAAGHGAHGSRSATGRCSGGICVCSLQVASPHFRHGGPESAGASSALGNDALIATFPSCGTWAPSRLVAAARGTDEPRTH